MSQLTTPPDNSLIRPNSGYMPYLDGLRGVAILMVLIVHAGGGILNGGFIGVDIFFVLSGYLITLLLLKEWDKAGRIHLGHFYARRALRLLPALMVLLLIYVITGFGMEPDWRARLRDGLIVLFYAGNWVQAMSRPLVHDLRHTWSLAIEEQFYMVWPVLMIAMLAMGWRRRTIGLAAAIGAGASVIWRVVMTVGLSASSDRVYHGLDTRADALLIGCAAAAWFGNGVALSKPRYWANGAAIVLLIIAAVGRPFSPWMFTLGYAPAALSAGILVVALPACAGTIVRHVTDWQPLIRLGRISYGVYLWHWSIFHIVGTVRKHYAILPGARGLVVLLVGSTLSIFVAWLSYRWVETPFLRLKRRFQ